MILFIGFELAKSSVEKDPSSIPGRIFRGCPLVLFSIVVKMGMAVYNYKMGRKINSMTLKAIAEDSRNDVIATSAVLIATLVEHGMGYQIDGFMGLVVSLFVLYSGISLARETISPLLGEGADTELHDKLTKYIQSCEMVIGCHDLMVHDYGLDLKEALQKQYDAQHESFSVFSIPKKKTLELHMNPTYDAEKLDKCLKKSEMYKGSTNYAINVPTDAKVAFSEEKKCLVVVPEDKGNVLQFQQLTKAVDEALAEGKETIDLANEEEYPEVYESPKIFSDDAGLKKKLDACNPYVMRWVSWKITDDRTEKVGPKLIYSWLRYKNGKVTFDEEKISDWVEKNVFEV